MFRIAVSGCCRSRRQGDLFLDLEGDPFYGSDEIDGIDYLFGVIEPGQTDAAGDPAGSTRSGRSRTAP